MLFHLSIEADDPRRVAQFLAEIMGGVAAPFPPVAEGSWMAMAGDDRGTAVEVYPRGTEIHETPGDHDAGAVRALARRHNATHFAIATNLDETEVIALCKRHGWPAKYRKRGGQFGVIEIFIEGCQMIEVLTDEMQREYLASATIENWTAMLKARGLTAAA